MSQQERPSAPETAEKQIPRFARNDSSRTLLVHLSIKSRLEAGATKNRDPQRFPSCHANSLPLGDSQLVNQRHNFLGGDVIERAFVLFLQARAKILGGHVAGLAVGQ